MTGRLAIVGAGGHARVVADAAELAGWRSVDCYDDSWPALVRNAAWPVVGSVAHLLSRLSEYEGVIVAIGDCRLRAVRHASLRNAGAPLVTVVHPAAWLSPRASVGAGSVLMACAVVNVGAVLGEACIVNTGATVDHDCRIGDAVHVAPGANLSGAVEVGARSWIGVGACVRQGVAIGCDVTVGAGTVVVKPLPDGVTVVGSPAKILRSPPEP